MNLKNNPLPVGYILSAAFLMLPTVIGANANAAELGIISIPMDFNAIQENACFPSDKICLKHEKVYMTRNGDYVVQPPAGHKFCESQVLTSNASPGAYIAVNPSLQSDGSAVIHYDIPCGGGGISSSTFTSAAEVAVSALIVAATVVATGGAGAPATAPALGTIEAIFAATSATALAETTAAYIAVSGASSAVVAAINPFAASKAQCGFGDAGNWVNGAVKLTYTKSYMSCDSSANFQKFSNQQPNTLNPAIPAILGLLLEDDEATSTPTAQTISFGTAPTLTVGNTATVSATATSGLAASFSSKTPSICTVAGSTVTGVAAGTCTIAADQSGNSSYSAAPQVTQNITVQPAGNGQTPVCTLSASPVVIAAGGSAKLTANCTPAATSYSWSNSVFASNASNGTVAPTATTQYSVTGKNSAGDGQAAAATVYVCNTPPSPNYPGLVLSGTGGTDQFTSSIGNDAIDGAAGIDTVVYNCNRSAFTVTKTASGWTIGSTVEGSDTLTNVERIRFGDETLALDLDGSAGKAYRVYQAAFNRKPDVGGLKYWIGQMDAGMDQREVAARFIDSNEFRTLYGDNPSNADFLTKLYNNVLHRAPDQGGYDWWLGKLNDGTYDKPGVLASFAESPENQAGVIGDILKGIDLPN